MTRDRAPGVDRKPAKAEGARQLQRELESARATVATRQQELDACERKLERLQSTLCERDFELTSAQRLLARNQSLLDSWRGTVREQERELIDGEERLVETELRAERLEQALASIRSGRAHKLMLIIWRLRRPFKRK